MSVTLLEVLAAACAQRTCLTAENAGFLVFSLTESLQAGPRGLRLAGVALTPQGDVCVLNGPVVDARECERELRTALRQLLQGAQRPGAGLLRVANADVRGLKTLLVELQSALVPLNRSAARRSLARLCRDTERAQQQGHLERSGEQVEAILAQREERSPSRVVAAIVETQVVEARVARFVEAPFGEAQVARIRVPAAPASADLTVPQPAVTRVRHAQRPQRPSPQRADLTPFLGTQLVTELARHHQTDPTLFGSLEVKAEHQGNRDIWSGRLFESVSPDEVELLSPTPAPTSYGRSSLGALLQRFNASLMRPDHEVRDELKGMCDVELTPHSEALFSSLTPPPVAAEVSSESRARPEGTPLGGFAVALIATLVIGVVGVTEYRNTAGPKVARVAAVQAPRSSGQCEASVLMRGVAADATVKIRGTRSNSHFRPLTQPGPNPTFEHLVCGEPLEVIVARPDQPAAAWRRIPVEASSLTPRASELRVLLTISAD